MTKSDTGFDWSIQRTDTLKSKHESFSWVLNC